MARKKRKKRARQGLRREPNQICLTCYDCDHQVVVECKSDDDTDQILDIKAPGWYTILHGVAFCPRHTIERALNRRPLYPLTERIYGDPAEHQSSMERFLERTRRRMERASWTLPTSEDSTT